MTLLNIGPGDDFLLSARLVPAGREGNKVFARSLRPDEEDTGEGITVRAGEQLVIPPGELVIDSRELDSRNPKGFGGYAPVADTVWTWYRIVPTRPDFFLFFFSLARRIDATHAFWTATMAQLEEARATDGLLRRTAVFRALAMAEVTVISLNRGLVMLNVLAKEFCPDLPIPDSVVAIVDAVHSIRNALEHIDERARGRTRVPGEEALSIFFQPDFVDRNTLRYGEHSLNLATEIPRALHGCREAIMDAIDVRVKLGLDPASPSSL